MGKVLSVVMHDRIRHLNITVTIKEETCMLIRRRKAGIPISLPFKVGAKV
jgi:hypothetical protein